MSSHFEAVSQPSGFRRIAAAMWDAPRDPTIYGFVDVEVSRTLQTIARLREDRGVRVTMTHVVAHAVARAFAAHPELNLKVTRSGAIRRRRRVDLVVSVATDAGRDLSAARIEAADELDLCSLAGAVATQVARTRAGGSGGMTRSRNAMRWLPQRLIRPALRLCDYVGNELDWHLPSLGIERDPFGSAVISNVGGFGIDTAFAPFVPLGRAPLLLLITEVRDRPWVENGQVVSRPVVRLCASFDHRVIDGFHAGQLARIIQAVTADPSWQGEAA